MTRMLETMAPITLPAPETEAERRFRVWMDAEARLEGPQGCGDEADAALDAVMATPMETLADLAALVMAVAISYAPEPDSPICKVGQVARSILVRPGDAVDPAAIRGRLLLAVDAFVKPAVDLPVGVQPEALASLKDKAIRRDLAQPLDKGRVYEAAMRFALPLE